MDEYSEYPDVKFMYNVILYADTSKSGEYVAWSTFQNFNQLQGDNLRVPLLKVNLFEISNVCINIFLSIPVCNSNLHIIPGK